MNSKLSCARDMTRDTRRVAATAGLVLALFVASGSVAAQGRGAAPAGPPPTPQAAAPIDLTGYWVAVVTEDWRWRMVTPPKGDYASVPLTDEGRKMADTWDVSKDGRCEAYGVGGVMRMPTRLNITWENPTTLKIETDAGQQTRRLLFNPTGAPPAQKTLQGYSVAEWDRPGGGGRGQQIPGGSLKVTTTNQTAGWLRRNGVPYTENAVITEYFDRFTAPNGDEWFSVTTIVRDPRVLNQEFVTSSHFKKEPNGSKFSPAPCRST